MITENVFADAYVAFTKGGGSPGRGVDHIRRCAETKAAEYHKRGFAYADFQPGNGTSYKLALNDLTFWRVEQEMAGVAWDPERHGGPEPADYARESRKGIRAGALTKDLAARVGGELLVSLPDNLGGVCFVVGMPALVLPDWLAGHVRNPRLGYADALPLAAFLFFFSDHLSDLREGTASTP